MATISNDELFALFEALNETVSELQGAVPTNAGFVAASNADFAFTVDTLWLLVSGYLVFFMQVL